MKKYNIAFFGSSGYSVITLETLKRAGIMPALIVTNPDKPQGRNLEVQPPPTKIWAKENGIEVAQPEKLNEHDFLKTLLKKSFDVFIVVAYGKIIPKEILEMPRHGTLNIHASLLPKYRGASPIESAIIADDKENGVTVMQIDEEMDHGPVIASKKVVMPDWPPTAQELGNALVEAGSKLLTEILPKWIDGKIEANEQDHSAATYTKKIEKSDGLINLADDQRKNFLKIQAYSKWPTAYFFVERKGIKIRVIIKKAIFANGRLEILKVIPEGKREMEYKTFLKSF